MSPHTGNFWGVGCCPRPKEGALPPLGGTRGGGEGEGRGNRRSLLKKIAGSVPGATEEEDGGYDETQRGRRYCWSTRRRTAVTEGEGGLGFQIGRIYIQAELMILRFSLVGPLFHCGWLASRFDCLVCSASPGRLEGSPTLRYFLGCVRVDGLFCSGGGGRG